MEFVNATSFGARQMSVGFGENRMLGTVIARPTFRIEGEALVPTPDQPWPIEAAPVETPYGTFPADSPFLSGGIDLFVLGNAYAPPGQAATEVRVDFAVGGHFKRSIRVIGDRVWRSESAPGVPADQVKLRPTAPQPFVSMPLTWERAFGGKAPAEPMPYSYPANPIGRGLYLTVEQAEGQPLPNLEDHDAPITSYLDRPEPVGCAPYPAGGSLRVLGGIDLKIDKVQPENSGIRRITPRFFNGAHPQMIVPPNRTPQAGELIEVTAVRPTGSLRFRMPAVQLQVEVALEDRIYHFPLHLDQIGILAEEQRVFLSYRVAYKYPIVPMELRRTTLRHAPAAKDTE